MLKQITFPANLESFYQTLLPIATFDIVPSEYSTDIMFTFSESLELDEDNYSEFVLLDYESHNSIPNLGSVFLFIAYLAVLELVVILGYLCIGRCHCLRDRHKKLRNYVFRSGLLLLIESAIEILASLYLNLVQFET